jgi:hypothetical protein
MTVDRPWALRNLGFDPITTPPPPSTFAFARAAVPSPALEDVRRGLTIKQQAALAAQIYKAYGRWSSVCSAIACWALIAAE